MSTHLTFVEVHKQMIDNGIGARFSQLSPRGLGYMILELDEEPMSKINGNLISILKLMGQCTDAASIFGGFPRDLKERLKEECLIQDHARKAIVVQHTKVSNVMKDVLDSALKDSIKNKKERQRSVDVVMDFLDAFSCFLKRQKFFKLMMRNHNVSESELIIFFSIMITMLENSLQAEHSDYGPEELSEHKQKHFPCACLLALEEDDTKLHIFPNSHRKVYQKYKTGYEGDVDIAEMVEIRLQKGQLLIFNALLLHYGPTYQAESKFVRVHGYVLHPKFLTTFLDEDGNTQTHPVDFECVEGYYDRGLRKAKETAIEKKQNTLAQVRIALKESKQQQLQHLHRARSKRTWGGVNEKTAGGRTKQKVEH